MNKNSSKGSQQTNWRRINETKATRPAQSNAPVPSARDAA